MKQIIAAQRLTPLPHQHLGDVRLTLQFIDFSSHFCSSEVTRKEFYILTDLKGKLSVEKFDDWKTTEKSKKRLIMNALWQYRHSCVKDFLSSHELRNQFHVSEGKEMFFKFVFKGIGELTVMDDGSIWSGMKSIGIADQSGSLMIYLMCADRIRLIDPSRTLRTDRPKLFQYVNIKIGEPASLGYPPLWHLWTSTQSKIANTIGIKTNHIVDHSLASKVFEFVGNIELKTESRRSIETEATGWITPTYSSEISETSFLKLSSQSTLKAIDIYRDLIPLSYGIPSWAARNRIQIKDLLRSPELILKILSNEILIETSDSVSLHDDRRQDFTLRHQLLESNWKLWTCILSGALKLKTQLRYTGRKTAFPLADAFEQFNIQLPPEGTRLVKPNGFRIVGDAFTNLKGLSHTFNQEFPGLGDKMMKWMTNRRFDITGWESWTVKEFYKHAEATFESNNWQVFDDRRNFAAAQTLVDTLSMITYIGSGSEYTNLMDSHTISEAFSNEKFADVLNNFIAVITGQPSSAYISPSALKHLRSSDDNTSLLANGEESSKWRHYSWVTAATVEIFSSYLTSIFSIGESDQTSQDFNPYVDFATSRYHDSWTWEPTTDLWSLASYSNIKRYFGSRSSSSTISVPYADGSKLVSELDSDFEAWALARFYSLTQEVVQSEIPINHIDSPFSSVWNIRQNSWSRSNTPTRPRLDFETGNSKKRCYYDLLAKLKNGKGLAFECARGKGQYVFKKDGAATSFLDLNIALITLLSTHSQESEYKNNKILIMGKQNPLVTREMFVNLMKLLFINEGGARLELDDLIRNALFDPEIYQLELSEAILLANSFGIQADGSIRSNMVRWWTIFKSSNIQNPASMFWIHLND